MPAISFHNEDIDFVLKNKGLIREWIETVIEKEKKVAGNIAYIFCSDLFLLELNKKYLRHDEYTDVITFDYSENELISGDIYISIDRVKENAKDLKTTFNNELRRVMVHGVLHLVGYKDKTPSLQEEMRNVENRYLRLLK